MVRSALSCNDFACWCFFFHAIIVIVVNFSLLRSTFGLVHIMMRFVFCITNNHISNTWELTTWNSFHVSVDWTWFLVCFSSHIYNWRFKIFVKLKINEKLITFEWFDFKHSRKFDHEQAIINWRSPLPFIKIINFQFICCWMENFQLNDE